MRALCDVVWNLLWFWWVAGLPMRLDRCVRDQALRRAVNLLVGRQDQQPTWFCPGGLVVRRYVVPNVEYGGPFALPPPISPVVVAGSSPLMF